MISNVKTKIMPEKLHGNIRFKGTMAQRRNGTGSKAHGH
jgi:hypothetical protein